MSSYTESQLLLISHRYGDRILDLDEMNLDADKHPDLDVLDSCADSPTIQDLVEVLLRTNRFHAYNQEF